MKDGSEVKASESSGVAGKTVRIQIKIQLFIIVYIIIKILLEYLQ